MVENYRVIDINDDDYRVLSLEKIINLDSSFLIRFGILLPTSIQRKSLSF